MRSFIIAFLFCFSLHSHGSIGPQMKDFLCGCEYCLTVNKGEPLDIAGHMIRCHSWRKGIQKTMELMQKSKIPEVEIEEMDKSPTLPLDSKKNNSTTSGHSWTEDDLYGWTYSNIMEVNIGRDKWVYLENLGWVWSPFFAKSFIYSYVHGWIYIRKHLGLRVIYLYDRRIWSLLKNFK